LIENVGNLVCPSSYDLGEAAKVVVLSVTEGEDKPLKYPSIFFKSDLLVLSKIDLLPYVPFDIEAAAENARKVHPGMEIVKVSCLTGNGLHEWMMWLGERRRAHKSLVQRLRADEVWMFGAGSKFQALCRELDSGRTSIVSPPAGALAARFAIPPPESPSKSRGRRKRFRISSTLARRSAAPGADHERYRAAVPCRSDRRAMAIRTSALS
jgi:hypothetical protein